MLLELCKDTSNPEISTTNCYRTCIASVLRIVNAIELVNSSDSVYDQQNSVWAAALEYTGIILIICAPTIPKLWHHLRGKGEKEVVPGGASSRQSADQHSRSRFYPNKTWIELGRTTRSSGLLAGPQNGQKISERDVERDLSYHDVKRSDSIIEPMKVYVRSEFSISVDEAKRRVSDPDINSVGFLRSPSIDKKDVITGYSRHSRK